MANELITLEALNPVDVYSGGLDSILNKIEEEATSIIPDISTEQGRKDIASNAYKIARSKTLIDEMGKQLGEDAKNKVDAINADRKKARDRLDALKEKVRKPLTDFEEAEKTRIADHEAALLSIPENEVYGQTESSDILKTRLECLKNYPKRDWQEFSQRYEIAMSKEIERTEKLLEIATKREAEQAELEKLRAEKEERDRQEAERLRLEREEKMKAEAAEKARKEAEELAAEAARKEAERVAAEKAKLQREKEEAEERAKNEEKERIAADDRARTLAIQAAERAEQEKQAAVMVERKRAEDKAKAEAAETAMREADKKHKAKIHNEIKEALQAVVDKGDIKDDVIKDIIVAIAKGEIPHVKIIY